MTRLIRKRKISEILIDRKFKSKSKKLNNTLAFGEKAYRLTIMTILRVIRIKLIRLRNQTMRQNYPKLTKLSKRTNFSDQWTKPIYSPWSTRLTKIRNNKTQPNEPTLEKTLPSYTRTTLVQNTQSNYQTKIQTSKYHSLTNSSFNSS